MLTFTPEQVLIESDWNLKRIQTPTTGFITAVLIESDWNLKGIRDRNKKPETCGY